MAGAQIVPKNRPLDRKVKREECVLCARADDGNVRKEDEGRIKIRRGGVEIDRDLSQKRVGPLALARLYGESRIFTVNFESFES